MIGAKSVLCSPYRMAGSHLIESTFFFFGRKINNLKITKLLTLENDLILWTSMIATIYLFNK